MRCIDGCGYNQKPDNLATLVRHIEECLSEGACQRLKKDPFVTWKNGEFVVVEKVTKKDRVFPITLIKKEALELTKDMIKTAGEAALAAARGANASMAAQEVTAGKPLETKNVKKIQADFGL